MSLEEIKAYKYKLMFQVSEDDLLRYEIEQLQKQVEQLKLKHEVARLERLIAHDRVQNTSGQIQS